MIACLGMLASAWVGTAEMGTLSVTLDAAPYRERRVRVRGQVRGDLDGDWSGLWLRIDGELASFDNTLERDADGGWVLHTVALDVPADAGEIAFGVLLSGNQTVQVDDLVLEDAGRARIRDAGEGRSRRGRRQRSAAR